MKRPFAVLALIIVACVMPASSQTCPSAADWCSGTYVYDGMGNIRAIGSDIYIYDTVGRLVSGTAEKQRGGASRQEYGYDAFGNRTSASRIAGSVDCLGGCEQSPTIDPVTNHITSNGAAYDAAGNLISITNTVGSTSFTSTYDYDALGSMTRASAGSDVRQFIYTSDGERIATRNGQSWTWTVRGLDGKVLREFTSTEPNLSPGLPGNPQWAKDYIWRDGLLLASVTAGPSGTTITQHYHLDHLGTPRVISNDAGVQTSIHAYYPFGAELNLGTEPSPGELMKFTGHERDLLASNPNTLDYMHARFEMGTMGRFLSVDTGRFHIEEPQSWNRYAYALNSPVRYADPDGRDAMEIAFINYRAKAFGIHLPFTGHAAFVTVDSHGRTRMYEYGRYDHPGDRGVVRRVGVPNVVMKDGKPTDASMKNLMASIAHHEGEYKGVIEGAYYKASDANTVLGINYADGKQAQNGDASRAPYNTGIVGDANNCATFGRDALAATGVKTSAASSDIKPTSTVEDLQKTADEKITYDANLDEITRKPPQ